METQRRESANHAARLVRPVLMGQQIQSVAHAYRDVTSVSSATFILWTYQMGLGGGDGLGRTAFDEQIVKALTFEINLIMFVTHIFEKKIICENGYKKKHLLKFQDCRIT